MHTDKHGFKTKACSVANPIDILLERSACKRTVAAAAIVGPLPWRQILRLVRLLRTGNEGEAFDAATVLGRLGLKRTTKPLVAVLRTSIPEYTKRAAIYVLHRLYDRRAARALFETARNRDNPEGV